MFITKAIRTNWVAFPHFARRANHTKALQVLKLYLINVRGVAVPDEFVMPSLSLLSLRILFIVALIGFSKHSTSAVHDRLALQRLPLNIRTFYA